MRNALTCLAAIFCTFAFAPASFSQETGTVGNRQKSATITGSYRLTGVMETGAQLLLSEDGTYKWALTVGGLDLYSEGIWTQAGGQVILGPHQFGKDTPVFALRGSYAWGEEEQDAALEMLNTRLVNRAKQKCAFLEYGARYGGEDEGIDENLTLKEQYEAAVRAEREKYDIYDKAITAYFERIISYDEIGREDDNMEISARTAKQDWESAVAQLYESGRAIGKSARYQPPPLPVDCFFVSDFKPQNYETDQNWSDGAGVWINRRDRPNSRLHIDAEFTFSDGSTAKANSYELGFAFAPRKTGQKLQSIALTLQHDDKEYTSSFDVSENTDADVYEVGLDNRVFIKPPFEELRLNISGDRLLSADGSRGSYMKVN